MKTLVSIPSLLLVVILCYAGTTRAQSLVPQLAMQSLSNSSYAIDSHGKLYVWGANESGELGIASTTDQNRPVQVAVPLGAHYWVRVAAGAHHALAIADSDKLYAWGDNDDGQLGIGTLVAQSTPARVSNPPGVNTWRSIAAGQDHSVALASNGMLYAWGSNSRGQLGVGLDERYASPQLIPLPAGVTSWVAVAAGDGVTLAVADGGELYAWGYDSSGASGQIGINGPTDLHQKVRAPSWLPALAAGLGNAVIMPNGDGTTFGIYPQTENTLSIAEGAAHTLSLDTSGDVIAQGSNLYGQLGSAEALETYAKLTAPSEGERYVAIAAGRRHSLALLSNGNIYAWGDNGHGQVGDGSGQPSVTTPTLVFNICDSLHMNASLNLMQLIAQPSVGDTAYHLSVSILCTGDALTAPHAELCIPSPWKSAQSTSVNLFPYTVGYNEAAVASWDIIRTSDSARVSGPLEGYLYLSANGSAPTVLPFTISAPAPSSPDSIQVTVRILDSLTRMPVAQAQVGDSQMTDTNGLVQLSFKPDSSQADSIQLRIMRWDYESRSLRIPAVDTKLLAVVLLPAQLQSNVKTQSVPPLQHLFVLDSIHQYGVSGDTVVASSNAGRTWNPVYHSPSNETHSVLYENPNSGALIGNDGTAWQTTDAGSTWVQLELPTNSSGQLNDLAMANGTLWLVGDSGYAATRSGDRPAKQLSVATTANIEQVVAVNGTQAFAIADSNCLVLSTSSDCRVINIGQQLDGIQAIGPDEVQLLTSTGQLLSLNVAGSSVKIVPIASVGSGASSTTQLTQNVRLLLNRNRAQISYDDSTWPNLPIPFDIDSWDVAGTTAYVVGQGQESSLQFKSGPLVAAVAGRVLQADSSRGLAGVQIILHQADGSLASCYSDAKGSFFLSNLAASTTPESLEAHISDTAGTWVLQQPLTLNAGETANATFIHPEQGMGVAYSPTILAAVKCLYSSSTAVNLLTSGLTGNLNVRVFNLLGECLEHAKVYSTTERFSLALPHLPAGTYIAAVQSEEGTTAMCRFVVLE